MKKEDIGGQWHDNQSRRPDQPRSTFGVYSQNSSHLCCRMNYLIGIPRRIDKARGESWNPNLIITITINPHPSNFLLQTVIKLQILWISLKKGFPTEKRNYHIFAFMHCIARFCRWEKEPELYSSHWESQKRQTKQFWDACIKAGGWRCGWGAFQWCFYLVFTLIHIIQGCRGQCSTG